MIFLTLAQPLYTAQMSVMMDRSNDALVSQLQNITSVVEDESSVLSQVELLKSSAVGMDVVTKYKLDENPYFANGGTRTLLTRLKTNLSTLFGLLTVGEPDAEEAATVEARRQQALDTLLDGVDVERVGRSYVLNIRYTSPSPELSP